MSHAHVSASSRSRKLPAIAAILGIIAGGCSPPGTGSVAVKDRGKIRENLEKGAKVTGPSGKAVKTDELGVKFRNKSKAD